MCSLIDAIFFQLPSAIPTCLTFYMFRESAEINRNLQKIARIKRHEFEEGGMRKERGSCGRPPEIAPPTFSHRKNEIN